MMEMKKYKLSEILTIKNGKDHKELKSGIYPVYGSGGIMRHVDTFLYDKPSILLPRKGTLDNIQYSDKPFWTVDTIYYTEVNFDLANPFYLYNFIKLLDLSNLDSGTGVPSMTFDSYYNLSVNLPPLPTQQKIAAVLSSLDDKIALNKKINAKLEAMAKRLYDYWFVQFDFPNEEGKPYKTSGGKMVWNEVLKRKIPEGWEVKSINEVCDVIDCLHSKKPDFCYEDEDSYLLSLENITKEGYIDISEKYYISKKDFSEWTSRICVKENDFLFTNAGRAGDMGMIPNGIKCAIGRNITAVRSKKINPYYLRCFFKSLYMKEQILNNLDKGCFFMSFNVRSIKQLSILIPKEENFHKFISFCEPIIKQLNKNNSEIQKLTNLRDRLLPLLMNGQVEVEG